MSGSPPLPPPPDAAGGETPRAVGLLVVQLGDERLGLRLSEVHEVLRAVAATPLRGAPPVVEGVIDVRGSVVPLLDLRRRFALPSRPVALSDRFVVTEAAGRRVALRVDAAEAVAEVDPAEITAAEGLGAAGVRLAGVARLPDGLVLIHDVAAFLSQTEAAALEEALAAERAGGAPA